MDTKAINSGIISAVVGALLSAWAVHTYSTEAIKKIHEIAVEREEELQQQLNTAKADADYYRGLNANLLRISRERANADRNLRPKKGHTGYVVMSSSEVDHTYYTREGTYCTVTLWSTVLQSPYSIEFPENQARKETAALFQIEDAEESLLSRIGIHYYFLDGYAAMIRSPYSDKLMEKNVLVNSKLQLNCRAGYWELRLLHTKPLCNIPKEIRPSGS